ncbi:MAG: DUF4339 domain-containing protein [Proteobacteria bacterium]|nr:DUF4339 domain-containing protein [Pseudomonadota bacterium]
MEAWIVSVAGQAYGPYSTPQMEAFAVEGRLVPHSLVAQPGDTQFRPASLEPALSAFFKPSEFAPQAPSTITATSTVQPVKQDDQASQKFGRQSDEDDGALTRFVVISDMKSGSIAGIEDELRRQAEVCIVLPQMWIVQSELTVTGLKNLLIQKLGKLDTLFVIDTSHDKAAWFNFSPEAESRIRRIWTKTPEAATKRKAG